MKKKQLKKTTKRRTLADKHRVDKKVKDHHRKVRKEARKAKKLGLPVKSASKLTRIPNIFPEKREMLEEQDLRKEIEKNRKKHSMITTDDLDNLVKEENPENVVQAEDEQENVRTKYDAKRDLNNLIKESDVLIEVLDARDPLSYRSKELEKNIYNNKDKRLIVIINKTDLVSPRNAEAWGKFIRRDIPTVLFSNKATDEKVYAELFEIINSITATMKKKVFVGLVGYPNTGKSSILKCLKSKYNTVYSKVIKGSNEIGITATLRFFDKSADILSKNETGPLMPKSSKSVQEVKSPLGVMKTIYENIPHDSLLELYEIPEFETMEEFLENVAKTKNYLIKGGYCDVERAARCVIGDVISGKIKYETQLE